MMSRRTCPLHKLELNYGQVRRDISFEELSPTAAVARASCSADSGSSTIDKNVVHSQLNLYMHTIISISCNCNNYHFGKNKDISLRGPWSFGSSNQLHVAETGHVIA
jgi:hypothetical protein